MFDFPPPEVNAIAKQNHIVQVVRYKDAWSMFCPQTKRRIYIGKHKHSGKEVCIIFDGIKATLCTQDENACIFEHPPSAVRKIAEQNHITNIEYDELGSLSNSNGLHIFTGKYINSKQEECIMFRNNEARLCSPQEHAFIFTIYR